MDADKLIKKYIGGKPLSQQEIAFLRSKKSPQIIKQFGSLFPDKERRFLGRLASLLRRVGPKRPMSALSQKPESNIESMHGRLNKHNVVLSSRVFGGGVNGTGKKR